LKHLLIQNQIKTRIYRFRDIISIKEIEALLWSRYCYYSTPEGYMWNTVF